MSFAIFIRDAEIVFTAPLLSTKASCAAYLSQKKNKKKVLASVHFPLAVLGSVWHKQTP